MKRRSALAAIFLLSAGAVFAAEKPSLVVVISVDQMRNDYLDRFRPWFARDGFNRFLQRGARFPEARHRHAATFTCPGHAAIGSGLDPRETGVVGNNWYDAAKGLREYCVEDRGAQWVGVPADAPKITVLPASPVLLSGHFLGDRLIVRNTCESDMRNDSPTFLSTLAGVDETTYRAPRLILKLVVEKRCCE